MSEGSPQNAEKNYDLSFEQSTYRPGVEVYAFKHVAVIIDTTGKNFSGLPELVFGTFDQSLNNQDILSQPALKREGVDMSYVSACLRKVAEVTGMHEFQFAAYGEDGHEEARLRLFKRYLDIRESPDKFGYIVTL
jgi:hypothetical protein